MYLCGCQETETLEQVYNFYTGKWGQNTQHSVRPISNRRMITVLYNHILSSTTHWFSEQVPQHQLDQFIDDLIDQGYICRIIHNKEKNDTPK